MKATPKRGVRCPQDSKELIIKVALPFKLALSLISVKAHKKSADPVRNVPILIHPYFYPHLTSEMLKEEKAADINADVKTLEVKQRSSKFQNADDELLAELGYKAEFKREFSVREAPSMVNLSF